MYFFAYKIECYLLKLIQFINFIIIAILMSNFFSLKYAEYSLPECSLRTSRIYRLLDN